MSHNTSIINVEFLDSLYRKYIENPQSIDSSWRSYFQEYDKSINQNQKEKLLNEAELKKFNEQFDLNLVSYQIISSYRRFGHIYADLNPLKTTIEQKLPELEIENYNIDQNQMEQRVSTFNAFGMEAMTLDKLYQLLKQTYCGKIAIEFEHIESLQERLWLQNKFELSLGKGIIDREKQIAILCDLIKAKDFEQYIHQKFPGAKRFSLEGGESTIVAINSLLHRSVKKGMKEAVFGMAHRGRLNVLHNVIKQPARFIFAQFIGSSFLPTNIAGDVKYHMGASCDDKIGNQDVHLSLTPNPSHLESVNSVVAGRSRAKQDLKKDDLGDQILPILIHGDAAVAGQGCVMESLVASQLPSYHVGGTIHLIINNQIGFTTDSQDGRSTRYCSDIAKAIDAPILHVNGNDPEAVFYAGQIAADYRYHFHKDIFIDIVCYRKYGHNEGDEPMFTQPYVYHKIQDKNFKDVVQLYEEYLLNQGVITSLNIESIRAGIKNDLDQEYDRAEKYQQPSSYDSKQNDIKESPYPSPWKNHFFPGSLQELSIKGISEDQIKKLGVKTTLVPNNFNLNSKIQRLFHNRVKALEEGKNIDWATGEILAYASILNDGINIRFAGEDVERGTFSHRHAVLVDQNNQQKYIPINHISESQKAKIHIHNSYLSEFGALAFEYGYSTANPNCLTIWEAQFGDFVNGAQIIIDQYISSGETKWLYMSGLVMLLPHGYEGQGPEHSSARVERFLQLCSDDNMIVCNCTTPSSFFHVIRRQAYMSQKKPLIIMTPKSLLRNKMAISNLDDFNQDQAFSEIIDDSRISESRNVRNLILCSGKVYYDIITKLEKRQDIAVVRMEQLYPFPQKKIEELLSKYSKAAISWCQEEHENMGPYSFIKPLLEDLIKTKISYIGRKKSSSPATGFAKEHEKEQMLILNQIISL